jgi:hypothetical protein
MLTAPRSLHLPPPPLSTRTLPKTPKGGAVPPPKGGACPPPPPPPPPPAPPLKFANTLKGLRTKKKGAAPDFPRQYLYFCTSKASKLSEYLEWGTSILTTPLSSDFELAMYVLPTPEPPPAPHPERDPPPPPFLLSPFENFVLLGGFAVKSTSGLFWHPAPPHKAERDTPPPRPKSG